MSRKTYWAVLFNPVILVLYAYGLSKVAEFCKYGNVAKRLPNILLIFAVGVLWLTGWTIFWFIRKHSSGKRKTADGMISPENQEDFANRGGGENLAGSAEKKDFVNPEGREEFANKGKRGNLASSADKKDFVNPENREDFSNKESSENLASPLNRKDSIVPAGKQNFENQVVPKKRNEQGSRKPGKLAKWLLSAELIALILISGHYGYKIYQAAQPYNGKLWSYLNKLQTTREIALDASARNFLKNGLDGILDLLAEKCDLDPEWELYTANTLKVTMDGDGTIQTIYAFLFALDDAGDYHAWLVTFDASKSDRMTVDLDNNASTDYLEQKRLTPLLEMIEALRNDTDLLARIGFAVEDSAGKSGNDDSAGEENETVFTLRYSGYADGSYQNDIEGTWYILEPAIGNDGNDESVGNGGNDESAGDDENGGNDENSGNDESGGNDENSGNDENAGDDENSGNDENDGNDENNENAGNGENNGNTWCLAEYTMPAYGGSDDGFLLNIYCEDIKVLTIITEAGTLETVAEIEQRESEEAEISEAKQAGNTLVGDSSGMTFYLNEETSMSLIVTDAAAGSRAYAFQNGDIYNEDPFSGRSGVAESIYFLDEETGFLLLSNASADASHMYYTDDGGVTFTEIFLPVSDGEADMAGNEFDYTSEDMDYIYTPYLEDDILYVEVSYDYSGRSYMKMLFCSEDRGGSWVYVSYESGS